LEDYGKPQTDRVVRKHASHLGYRSAGESDPVNIFFQNFDIDLKIRANPAEHSNESWTFGPSASKPFYDLQVHTTSELTIRRHHPQKPSTIVPIAVLNLEPSTRHLPPQDGLVTLIFPKLAALMAMDQATSTASKYGLPQTDCESITSEAVARAADREACKLRWDADSKTYQLIHPTLANGTPQTFSIVTEGGAGFAGTGNAKGRISLLSPDDSTSDLVSLDFTTQTLTVNTHPLITHHPSLYIIDVTVTAVLAVALLDGRRSAIQTPTFSAPPTIAEVEEGRGKLDLMEKYVGGKELPQTTRGVLKLLFWAFRLVVWALTVSVNLLAKVVVGVSALAQKA